MVTVTTNAELMSAISSAIGGDRIELTAGDYGSISITGVGSTFFPDVSIVSADPANPAIVSSLIVSNSSHLVFDGILFDYATGLDNPPWYTPFQVNNSSYITIRNSVFDGDEVPAADGVEYGTGKALTVQSSDNVVIEYNEFFNFWKGLTVEKGSTNTIVGHNNVHSMRSDGFNFISVDGLLVEGNWFHDFKMLAGDHSDMIQFWAVKGEVSARNVIIRGNFIDAGDGDLTQSIFMGNGLEIGNFEEYAYRNILIEDNVIYNAHLHGITVDGTDGFVVRNNTLLFDAAAKFASSDWAANGRGAPRIKTNDLSVNVTIESNVTSDVWNWESMVGQPNWTVSNNLLLDYDPDSPDYYGDLFVNALVYDATLADLRAVADGVIEVGAIGAAMTRADIPMVVGPYATAPVPVPELDVCEALLADALIVLAAMTDERDAALAERDTALTALNDAEAALATMTDERDVALTERDTAVASLAAMTTLWDEAMDTLVVTEAQLAVEVAKLDAILVIAGGN